MFVDANNHADSGLARYANDDNNNPNMKLFAYFFQGEWHLGFQALREIGAGEELTWNYGEDVLAPWRDRKKPNFR